MPRVRDLGIYESALPCGPLNGITDVPGVAVGHCTVIEGEGAFTPGTGPYRTGVTVVVPHPGNLYEDKVAGAAYAINGFGKYTGLEQVRETGSLESPIALTGTLNMPRVADALITLALEANPYIGVGFEATGRQGYASVNPVVGECNDGFLNDMHGRRIGEAELRQALASASTGAVAEGAVGGGTGLSCFEWKGGIGSASRRVPDQHGGFTLGVLVQSNFGAAAELVVSGVPVGRHIRPPDARPTNTGETSDQGSIVMVIATDAPLDGRQLERISRPRRLRPGAHRQHLPQRQRRRGHRLQHRLPHSRPAEHTDPDARHPGQRAGGGNDPRPGGGRGHRGGGPELPVHVRDHGRARRQHPPRPAGRGDRRLGA